MIDPPDDWREATFADFVSREAMKRGGASLAELTKQQPPNSTSEFRTSLIERWERAWCKPLNQLTCAELLTLFRQGDGLPWLASAIAEFVENYPNAELDFYPGDLTVEALRQFDALKAADPGAAKRIASLDLTALIESFRFSRSLKREAQELHDAVKSQRA